MAERAQLLFDRTLVDLTREFELRGNVREVYVPPELYNEFLNLYRRSEDMQRKITDVINDGEHQLIMEEGRDFFKLPHSRYMQEEMSELKGLLKSFNPYQTAACKDGRIKLSDKQVEGFFKLFSKDYDIVRDLFDTFRNTDYLDYHRYLRDVKKVPYAGPTSLQEIVNVYFGICRAHKRQSNYFHQVMDARYEKLEQKVVASMAADKQFIEISPLGMKVLQNAPAP